MDNNTLNSSFSDNGQPRQRKGLTIMGAGAGDDPIEAGREILAAWEAAQPDNYFTADPGLSRTLAYHWTADNYREHAGRLYQFGALAATAIAEAARQANEPDHLPRLNRFDRVGQRIEEVIYHPAHHEAGRHIYGSGMLSVLGEPGHNLLSTALFYLSAQSGEAGHHGPLATTAGLIRLLQAAGSADLQARYLPGLLDPNYETRLHAAQFLAEVQSGSDLGAHATEATPLDPEAEGSWLLNGEKWFCSNVTADLALVTARVAGQGEGMHDPALFLVPRRLADGALNGVYIRRLKDKSGTRSLATAEIELRDALAYQIGAVDEGLENLRAYVSNTSRIFNAVAATANARRAYVVAWTYAQHRIAFNRPLARFPLVQDLLARMHADVKAMLSGSFHIASLLDQRELGQGDDDVDAVLRVAVNLNQYRTAALAGEVIHQGIEILGGNGTIESFSVLPRLLRDHLVYETWAGTPNVLIAQLQRDMRQLGVHQPFLSHLARLLEPLVNEDLRDEALQYLNDIRAELDSLLDLDELSASIYFRPLMDRLADLYYTACLASEGEWEMRHKKSRAKMRAAYFYLVRRAGNRPAKEIPGYTDEVGHLCASL